MNAGGCWSPTNAARRSGGIAEAVIADLAENGFKGTMRSVRAVDSYVPLGAAANLVLISEEQIVEAGRDVTQS